MTDTDVVESAQVVVEAGISYRQLDHWTRHGWLVPTASGRGSGFPRGYDRSQVQVAKVMAELSRILGIRASVAYPIARALIDHSYYQAGDYYLTWRTA